MIPTIAMSVFSSLFAYHKGAQSYISSKGSFLTDGGMPSFANNFTIGFGSGMALYALSAHVILYWRIRERVRNFYNGVSINYIGYLNDAATQFVKGFVYKYIYSTTLEIGNTENESSDVTFSTVTSKSCIKLFNTSILRTIPIGDDTCPSGATKQILCSPSSDRTSTIHAVLLSIPPKCTMNFEKARGLEVYFVLEGNGSIRVNTGTEEKTEKIIANDSFVINPFTKRCLFNQGWRCLRVIRITDGGNTYEDTNLDITSKIPSSLTRRKTIDTFIVGASSLTAVEMVNKACHGLRK